MKKGNKKGNFATASQKTTEQADIIKRMGRYWDKMQNGDKNSTVRNWFEKVGITAEEIKIATREIAQRAQKLREMKMAHQAEETKMLNNTKLITIQTAKKMRNAA
ncbi:MAG: hypothetical protein FWG80_05065 [Alphaproteobacteria bacterium]|nr:hypothetical protein [Alphaproteobacteria bacterium]